MNTALKEARTAIINHPLYAALHSIEDLRLFASHHVYAVWDFMSLLKSLQQQLTCVDTPWTPKGTASTRFLINEIVVGEESDIDANGNHCSHFELYLRAMQEMGADTAPVEQLLLYIRNAVPVREAMQQLNLPASVQSFCRFTFDIVESAPLHVQAAVFAFGREDLIPDMFLQLVAALKQKHPQRLATFVYYFERHIEVDGGHHSQLAMQMVDELCQNDPVKKEEAMAAAVQSLHMRKVLWDGIEAALKNKLAYA